MKKNVALIFIAISLVGTGLYVYSLKVVFPKPENCSICHFMTPYYAKWKTSTHNKVACLKCHDYDMTTALAAQFKYLTGRGGRAAVPSRKSRTRTVFRPDAMIDAF